MAATKHVAAGGGTRRYRNLGGNSGVAAYAAAPGAIAVQFADGTAYVYTEASAGAVHIAEMQALAERGQGLGGYINRHVRDRYERKA